MSATICAFAITMSERQPGLNASPDAVRMRDAGPPGGREIR